MFPDKKNVIVSIPFLLVLFLLGSSVSYAQDSILYEKVSVSLSNTTIDEALDLLSEKCECYFTYNSNLIQGNKSVNIEIQDLSLHNALDSLLQNPSVSYQQINKQIVIHPIRTKELIVIDTIKTVELQGVIKDKNSRNPLPYAVVSLKNEYLGTVANHDGAYNFIIENSYLEDTLVFSHLGYFSVEIPINEFPEDGEILLDEGVIPIQEIVVRTLSADFLLEKLISNIPNNYQKKPFNYQAFYREYIKLNNKHVVYSEALLDGYKPKLSTEAPGRVEVTKGRKYIDPDKVDTLIVKLRGGVETCLELDIVRDLPSFLSEEDFDKYNYSMSDVVIWQDNLVYVIDFSQKKHIEDLLMQGQLYISTTNFSLLGADFRFTPEVLVKSQDRFVIKKSRGIRVRPLSSNYTVKYQHYNGVYYPQYVHGKFEFKVKKRKALLYKKYETNMEMAYTRIDTTNVNIPKRQESIKLNSILSDHLLPYNYEYWHGQNIIQPESNILDAIYKSGMKIEEENWVDIE